jgi:hypothetical protein
MNDYTLQFVKYFVQACEKENADTATLEKKIKDACGH